MAAVPVTVNPVRIAPDAFPVGGVKEKEGIKSVAGKLLFEGDGPVETSMIKCQPNPDDSVRNAASVPTVSHTKVDLTVNGSDVQTSGADLGSVYCCFDMVVNRQRPRCRGSIDVTIKKDAGRRSLERRSIKRQVY